MDWSNFVLTVLGGVVSAGSGLLLFYHSERVHEKNRLDVERQAEATLAYSGFRKVLSAANAVWNLEAHINDSFKNASEEGNQHFEPYQKVLPMVGFKPKFNRLETPEIMFLAKSGKLDLIDEASLMIDRAENIWELMDGYSKEAVSLKLFLETNATETAVTSENAGRFDLRADHAALYVLKAGAMQEVLGKVTEYLEKDLPLAKEICQKFGSHASEYFGHHFPFKAIEWAG